MPTKKSPYQHKKLALAVGAALIASASTANALMIENTITVDTSVSVPGAAGDMDTATDSSFASISSSASDGTSAGFARAFGRNTGTYATDVDTDGAGSSTASFSWTRKVTNDESDPLNVFLDLYIYSGFLEIGAVGQIASYAWNITATTPDGVISVLDSTATIDGISVSEGGADGGLDTDNDDDPFFYDWNSRTISDFALGQLLPDEMLTIQYDLVTSIDGSGLDLATVMCDPRDDEYGGDFEVAFTSALVEEGYGGCFASSFTGDPSQISTTPLGSQSIVGVPARVSDVPEPGSLVLMGTGVLGAAAARRRKKKTDS